MPKLKERAAGVFTISGKLGDKKPEKAELVQLELLTKRGVILLNVDPAMVPPNIYIYVFNVDGMTITDPINPMVKLRARSSAVVIAN